MSGLNEGFNKGNHRSEVRRRVVAASSCDPMGALFCILGARVFGTQVSPESSVFGAHLPYQRLRSVLTASVLGALIVSRLDIPHASLEPARRHEHDDATGMSVTMPGPGRVQQRWHRDKTTTPVGNLTQLGQYRYPNHERRDKADTSSQTSTMPSTPTSLTVCIYEYPDQHDNEDLDKHEDTYDGV
ncbi:hypothetical protein BDZ89DRAFT_1146122 [Hymenopellis radicata]|nr:hypothetical protein BDZ89DRAFT_1146122 [Hymenopellis radicata]